MPAAKIESINNPAITPNDGSRALGQQACECVSAVPHNSLAAIVFGLMRSLRFGGCARNIGEHPDQQRGQ